ncbi:MAG: aspartate carbamoyltransferase [Patescibacteria group bacterium]|nr:aspartate carbamoyltransferase [Patescibacteria group bacterium]
MKRALEPVTLADAVKLPSHHVIEAQPFGQNTGTLLELFRLADRIRALDETWAGRRQLQKTLAGTRVFSVFGQPSTRTRFSFETAAKVLGADVIGTENAGEFSSEVKGESIEDTVRMLCEYGADAIIIRHPKAGAAARAARVSTVPVINAGDGGNQHPTQALLDVYTIWREFGRLDNLTITMVGDLRYGRTARSLAYLMARFDNIKMVFVSPPSLQMGAGETPGDGILAYLRRHGVGFEPRSALGHDILAASDVVYATRIQLEQMARELTQQPPFAQMTHPQDSAEFRGLLAKQYEQAAGSLSIGPKQLQSLKPEARVLHPLPRVEAGARDKSTGIALVPELDPQIDSDDRAAYFRQAGNGEPLRAALLLSLVATSSRQE